jgi:hypothetical protein
MKCPACGNTALEDPSPEEEPEPPPREKPPVKVEIHDPRAKWKGLNEGLTRIIAAVGWIVCGFVTLYAIGFFLRGMSAAISAPQEASVAGASCFIVITGYVVARTWDKLIRG